MITPRDKNLTVCEEDIIITDIIKPKYNNIINIEGKIYNNGEELSYKPSILQTCDLTNIESQILDFSSLLQKSKTSKFMIVIYLNDNVGYYSCEFYCNLKNHMNPFKILREIYICKDICNIKLKYKKHKNVLDIKFRRRKNFVNGFMTLYTLDF